MISNNVPALIIIEDHAFTREGVIRFLSQREEVKVIADFSETRPLLSGNFDLKPDIILLDLNLPGLNGEISCGLLKKQFPDCKIIAFTDHLIGVDELKALNFDGRYMKGQDTAILIDAIKAVLKGNQYFTAHAHELKGVSKQDKLHPYLLSKNITTRELEIVLLYLQDMSNKEIADKLFISETTVNTHKRNFKYKIGKNKKKEIKDFLDNIGLDY